jgi:serine/threonine-protein kinase
MAGAIYLDKYEIVRLLGEGGMGRVFLARQLDLERQVVVKVMHDHVAADPKFRERFRREMLLMARFQHPHAVSLYDASLNDPRGPCIIMEYIRGVTLDTVRLNNQGRLSPGRVGRLLGQLCEVLQAAYSEGIIHRDIKPANLMVTEPDTPYENIKVLDFGLAKLKKPAFQVHPVSGISVNFNAGTPAYMSPEQGRGQEVDCRADLYSVGVILYELLTGRVPFIGSTPMEVMVQHATEQPPSFAAVGAADIVPPGVEAVVLSCLAKNPAQRPQSARELAERYEVAWVNEEVSEAKPQPAEHPGPPQAIADLDQSQIDTHAEIFHMEAWMPEAVAKYKLHSYIRDTGGELLESVPGLIRVRLGGWNSVYRSKSGYISWLGLKRKSGQIELDLRMRQPDPKANNLVVTVIMHSLQGEPPDKDEWQARCSRIYNDLRSYLMGKDLQKPD